MQTGATVVSEEARRVKEVLLGLAVLLAFLAVLFVLASKMTYHM